MSQLELLSVGDLAKNLHYSTQQISPAAVSAVIASFVGESYHELAATIDGRTSDAMMLSSFVSKVVEYNDSATTSRKRFFLKSEIENLCREIIYARSSSILNMLNDRFQLSEQQTSDLTEDKLVDEVMAAVRTRGFVTYFKEFMHSGMFQGVEVYDQVSLTDLILNILSKDANPGFSFSELLVLFASMCPSTAGRLTEEELLFMTVNIESIASVSNLDINFEVGSNTLNAKGYASYLIYEKAHERLNTINTLLKSRFQTHTGLSERQLYGISCRLAYKLWKQERSKFEGEELSLVSKVQETKKKLLEKQES